MVGDVSVASRESAEPRATRSVRRARARLESTRSPNSLADGSKVGSHQPWVAQPARRNIATASSAGAIYRRPRVESNVTSLREALRRNEPESASPMGDVDPSEGRRYDLRDGHLRDAHAPVHPG